MELEMPGRNVVLKKLMALSLSLSPMFLIELLNKWYFEKTQLHLLFSLIYPIFSYGAGGGRRKYRNPNGSGP